MRRSCSVLAGQGVGDLAHKRVSVADVDPAQPVCLAHDWNGRTVGRLTQLRERYGRVTARGKLARSPM
jgi:hypothetical protein